MCADSRRRRIKQFWIVLGVGLLLICAGFTYELCVLYVRHNALCEIQLMGGEAYAAYESPVWFPYFLGHDAKRLFSGTWWIGLENCSFGDDQLWIIDRLKPSAILILSGTNVTDAAFPSLVKLRTLRVLGLSSTQITSIGFSALHQLPNLEQLDVSYTVLDDNAIRTLCQMRLITRLHIVYDETARDGQSSLEVRLQELSKVFSVRVRVLRAADKPISIIIQTDETMIDGWSDQDVVRRWARICQPKPIEHRSIELTDEWVEIQLKNTEWIQEIRQRLKSPGWFMKFLNSR